MTASTASNPMDRLRELSARIDAEESASECIAHKVGREMDFVIRSLDAMGAGLVAVDESGEFRVFNRAGERIIGLGRRKVSPEDWNSTYRIYEAADADQYMPAQDLPLYRALTFGDTVSNVPVWIEHAPGDRRRVICNAWPIIDEVADQIIGAVCLFHGGDGP